MATMADVARRAGVSAMTVSRVINGHPHVSEKARARILDAIADLGYRPNMLARALTTSRTGTVGVMLSRIENHMYSRFVASIARDLQERQLDVLLCDAETEAAYLRGMLTLAGKRVDGIIVLPFEFEAALDREAITEAERLCVAEGIPCVYIGDQRGEGPRNRVLMDYEQGAHLAARHLIELGHRQIGYVGSAQPGGLWDARLAGFLRALGESGLRLDPRFAFDAHESIDESHMRARAHLGALDAPPSAYFCANDLRAIGLIRALTERGLRVPDDVSVIGHDGSIFCQCTAPQLTSVSLCPGDCGRAAAAMLLSILVGELPKAGNERIIRQVLLPGESTAPPR